MERNCAVSRSKMCVCIEQIWILTASRSIKIWQWDLFTYKVIEISIWYGTHLQMLTEETTWTNIVKLIRNLEHWIWFFGVKCSWVKFEEDVEEGGSRWSKPHVATLSLHSLFELRSLLLNGPVLLDADAQTLVQITDLSIDMMANSGHLPFNSKDRVNENKTHFNGGSIELKFRNNWNKGSWSSSQTSSSSLRKEQREQRC